MTDRSDIPNEIKSLSNTQNINQYTFGEKLGQGTFGLVRLATHIQTGERVAVKILEREKILEHADKARVEREINILKVLRHNNIVHLYSVIQTNTTFYFIMEYANGKELFDYIINKKRLHEGEACSFYQQILSGVEYLHKLRIVHRDLKPENLLLNANNEIKIVDFGLSNLYAKDEMLSTACGSLCYAAPEMVSGKKYNGIEVDIWSTGIILYAMICGYLPFEDQNHKLLNKKIVAGKFTMPFYISELAKDLIKKILTVNPTKRITISQIKKHPWFNLLTPSININEGLLIQSHVIPIDEDLVEQMKDYGYDKRQVRKDLLTNKHNHTTTAYYLLLKKKIRKNIPSIADLTSSLFMNYVNDPKNLISRYNNNLDEILLDRVSSERRIEYTDDRKNMANGQIISEVIDIIENGQYKIDSYREKEMIIQSNNTNHSYLNDKSNEKVIHDQRAIKIIENGKVDQEETKDCLLSSLENVCYTDRIEVNSLKKNKEITKRIIKDTHKDNEIIKNSKKDNTKNPTTTITTDKLKEHYMKIKKDYIIKNQTPKQTLKTNELKVKYHSPSQKTSYDLLAYKIQERKRKDQNYTMTIHSKKPKYKPLTSINIAQCSNNTSTRGSKSKRLSKSTINNEYSMRNTDRHNKHTSMESQSITICQPSQDDGSNTQRNEAPIPNSRIETESIERKQVDLLHKQILKSGAKNKVKKNHQKRYHNKTQSDAHSVVITNNKNSSSINEAIELLTPKKIQKVNSDKAIIPMKISSKGFKKLENIKTKICNVELVTASQYKEQIIRLYNPKKKSIYETPRGSDKLIPKRIEKNRHKKFFNTSVSFDKTYDDSNLTSSHQLKYNEKDYNTSPDPESKREKDKIYLQKKAVNKRFDTIKEENNSDIIKQIQQKIPIQPMTGRASLNKSQLGDFSAHAYNDQMCLLDKGHLTLKDLNGSSSNKKIRTCNTPFDLSCLLIQSPQEIKENINKVLTQSKVRYKNLINQPYKWHCDKSNIKFELELFHIKNMEEYLLVKAIRTEGNISTYREMINNILAKIITL